MRNKLVKVVTADEAVEVVEEVEALFVRDCAVDVLGVDILVADDQLGVLVLRTKLRNSLLCKNMSALVYIL